MCAKTSLESKLSYHSLAIPARGSPHAIKAMLRWACGLTNPSVLSQELLYNVQEKPEVGIHPRHLCIELDDETQSIIGMGQKGSGKGATRAAAAVDRLQRSLRTKGFRTHLTVQMVRRGSCCLKSQLD